jgi:hypothetical protein
VDLEEKAIILLAFLKNVLIELKKINHFYTKQVMIIAIFVLLRG